MCRGAELGLVRNQQGLEDEACLHLCSHLDLTHPGPTGPKQELERVLGAPARQGCQHGLCRQQQAGVFIGFLRFHSQPSVYTQSIFVFSSPSSLTFI